MRDESCLSVPLYSIASLNLVREVVWCPPSKKALAVFTPWLHGWILSSELGWQQVR